MNKSTKNELASTRRRFVQGVAASVALPFVAKIRAVDLDEDDKDILYRLLAAFPNLASFGERVQNSTKFEERVFEPAVAGRLALLEEQVRRDFATGDTVVVDGWVISRSEAALCKLLFRIDG